MNTMNTSSTLSLDEQARAILTSNDWGGYTVPTAGLYPYQWNWDSVFAAWGFSTFDLPRAWTEIETLFDSQWDDGMVPHIVFHRSDPGYFPGPDVWETHQTPATSGISQPPVAAILSRQIWAADPENGEAHMRALYPKMLAWHRWWHEVRCVHGPVAIVHPWESGRDNCPDWDIGMANVDTSNVGEYQRRDTDHADASHRPQKLDYDRFMAIVYAGRDNNWDQKKIVAEGPFLMADPGITFMLLRAHRDLAAIGRQLGEDVTEIEGWATALRGSLNKIWNDELGAYDARDLLTGNFAGILGSGAVLALLCDASRPELDAHIKRMWDAVEYGIPSSDPHSSLFDPKRYWRGPTWPVVNALIAIGLRDSGRLEDEARLRRETAALIQKGGFAEYCDPTDGSPCGGDNFTWTAAIWLTWAGQKKETE